MASGPRYRVPFRRRREGFTDYRTRLSLLKSRKTRVVVRKSLRTINVQFIDYAEKGDVIVAAATSRELEGQGWTASSTATPAAYLTGLLAGSRAKARGVADAVLDLGRQSPTRGGRIFAALKGVLDAGVAVPHDAKILPTEERLKGEHLTDAPLAQFAKVSQKIKGGA